MCVCMSECLHSSPETITTFLLISYTPLQNKKFKIVTNKDLQGTLLNVMWQPGWEGSLGRMDTYLFRDESHRCSPITTLLTSY